MQQERHPCQRQHMLWCQAPCEESRPPPLHSGAPRCRRPLPLPQWRPEAFRVAVAAAPPLPMAACVWARAAWVLQWEKGLQHHSPVLLLAPPRRALDRSLLPHPRWRLPSGRRSWRCCSAWREPSMQALMCRVSCSSFRSSSNSSCSSRSNSSRSCSLSCSLVICHRQLGALPASAAAAVVVAVTAAAAAAAGARAGAGAGAAAGTVVESAAAAAATPVATAGWDNRTPRSIARSSAIGRLIRTRPCGRTEVGHHDLRFRG
mmetsp:Transcript_138971/g.352319  ORF Transcript_138971/g.352319 Transcript_138971/m.352319 type:complete len:261 (-) Transcript_138971:6-788(-)